MQAKQVEPWLGSVQLLDELVPAVAAGGALERAANVFLQAFGKSAYRTLDGRALASVEGPAVTEAWGVLDAICTNMLSQSDSRRWQIFSDLPHNKPDFTMAVPGNLSGAVAPHFYASAGGSEQPFRLEALGRLRISLHGARKLAMLDGYAFAKQFMKSPEATGQDIQVRANALSDDDVTPIMATCPGILSLVAFLASPGCVSNASSLLSKKPGTG